MSSDFCFSQLYGYGGLASSTSNMLSVKNCPEFLRQALEDWCQANGQPGKPNQNACIERSNCTCRNKALNLYLFRSLQEVREIAGRWVDECNDR